MSLSVVIWRPLYEVVSFLRGQPQSIAAQNPVRTWSDITIIMAIKFLLVWGLASCLDLLMPALGVSSSESAIGSLLEAILIAVILFPLLEEFAFRRWLDGRPRLTIAFAMAAGGIIGFEILDAANPVFTESIERYRLVLIGVMSGIVPFLLPRAPIQLFLGRHLAALFWFSAFFFAWFHATNFDGAGFLGWKALPLVLPQLISAVVYGYIRIRFGFWHAVVAHCLNNALGLSLFGLS